MIQAGHYRVCHNRDHKLEIPPSETVGKLPVLDEQCAGKVTLRIDMPISSYYDASDRQRGSIRIPGDHPRHESMFSDVTPKKWGRV